MKLKLKKIKSYWEKFFGIHKKKEKHIIPHVDLHFRNFMVVSYNDRISVWDLHTQKEIAFYKTKLLPRMFMVPKMNRKYKNYIFVVFENTESIYILKIVEKAGGKVSLVKENELKDVINSSFAILEFNSEIFIAADFMGSFQIKCFRFSDFKQIHAFKNNNDSVTYLERLPDDKFASCSWNKFINIYSITKNQLNGEYQFNELQRFSYFHTSTIYKIIYDKESKALLSTSWEDEGVVSFDYKNGSVNTNFEEKKPTIIKTKRINRKFRALDVVMGNYVMAGWGSGSVITFLYLYDKNGEVIKKIKIDDGKKGVSSIKRLPNSSDKCVVAKRNGEVDIWNLRTEKKICTLPRNVEINEIDFIISDSLRIKKFFNNLYSNIKEENYTNLTIHTKTYQKYIC